MVAALPVPARAEDCVAHPPGIVLNQSGFAPGALKRATLVTDAASEVPWRVFGPDGETVLAGRSAPFGESPAAEHAVHRIDVSALDAHPGPLVITACGTTSRPFAVEAGVYRRLRADALSYFTLNRAGEPVLEGAAPGPEWARRAGHLDGALRCVSGKDRVGRVWPGCRGRLFVEGGWYDAGDYGRYVVNGGLAAWTLQNLAERARVRGGADEWADALLAEARVEMRFLLSMQSPLGRHVGVRGPDGAPRVIDAGGLVHHAAHAKSWPALPLAPADDASALFLSPPSTAASLNLAAAAAQCARLWRTDDPDFAARCLTAARTAYEAARLHPAVYASRDFDGGGAYDDQELADEFAWAASELYLSTGEAAYRRDLQAGASSLAQAPAFALTHADIYWARVDLLPALSFALAADQAEETRAAAVAALTRAADAILVEAALDGYGAPLGPEAYSWGSNGTIANRGLILGAAYDATGVRAYRDAATAAMDYMMGRNPLDVSFVSGYGGRAMSHPHHRFWAQGADASFPPAPPGALSGGPNSQAMLDPVAQSMAGSCAPQTCWRDEAAAYALNEVAINWNAPLVWLATFLDDTEAAP